MATKYEIIQIDKAEITVDVSLLIKSEELFFNATEMAKTFGKAPAEYLRLPSTDKYIEALIILSGDNTDMGKSHIDFVKTKRGGKYQGTWLHKKLALDFARWLSPLFAVRMDQWVEQRLKEEQSRKRARLESKTGYLPMTDAIMKAHDPIAWYHFSNEADMINTIVLGMPAKKYKELHGVENVRDSVTAAELAEITRLQRINTGLIEIGMPYDDRKEALSRCHEKELLLLDGAA